MNIFLKILNWPDKVQPLICTIFGGPSRFLKGSEPVQQGNGLGRL